MKKLLLVKLFFFVFFNLKSSEKFLEFLLTYDSKKIFTKKDIIQKIFESFLGTNNLFLYLKKKSSDKNFIKFISLIEELIKPEKNKFYIKSNEKEEANKKIADQIIGLKNFFIDELRENIFNKYNLSLKNLLNSNFFNLDDSNNSIKTSINYEFEDFLNFLNLISKEEKLKIYLKDFLDNSEQKNNLLIDDLNYLENLTYEEFKNNYNSNPLLKLITKNYYSCNFTYFPEDFLLLKENKKYFMLDTFYRYYLKQFIIESFPLSNEETNFYIFLSCKISEEFNSFLNSNKIQEILDKNKKELLLKGVSPKLTKFERSNILDILVMLKNYLN